MKTKQVWTAEDIKEMLEKSALAVERGILALFKQQTTDEQAAEETHYLNGRGFSGTEAHYGTYLAKYIIGGNNLTGKHLLKARKITIRHRVQLAKIANKEL